MLFLSSITYIIAAMNMDMTKTASHRRRTKIIATLGPGTDDPEVLQDLIRAGVDVFRLNMSHGDAEQQIKRAQMVREAASSLHWQVALLVDLQGPKIRVEKFEGGGANLEAGDHFTLDSVDVEAPGDDRRVGVSYTGLPDDVKPDDVLLLDDGLISMRVQLVEGGQIHCLVENGGWLGDRKGLNMQGGGLSISGLSEHDLPHIELAARMGADYLAVSFVSSAEDIVRAKNLLRESGSEAAVVAKIERMEAIDNLEEICDSADVIMVARGDLGVEIGDEELPGLQKQIIRTAIRHNRIVATATQMMQSMIENPIPTRAEVLDVANAVLDGTDAVMLSAETAVGKHPLKVIEAMNRICLGAERHFEQEGDVAHLNVRFERIDQAIAMASMFMATNVQVDAIIALTESGSTAQWLSRVQSAVPIYAFSTNAASRRRMAMFRDVFPVSQRSTSEDADEVLAEALQTLLAHGAVKEDDRVIVTMGDQMCKSGGTNTMRFIKLDKDGLDRYLA
jgi:pyruvate kinase